MFRHAGRVLGFEIVKLVARNDLDGAQCPVLQNADLDLPPVDELLDQHFTVIAESGFQCCAHVLRILHDADADR